MNLRHNDKKMPCKMLNIVNKMALWLKFKFGDTINMISPIENIMNINSVIRFIVYGLNILNLYMVTKTIVVTINCANNVVNMHLSSPFFLLISSLKFVK